MAPLLIESLEAYAADLEQQLPQLLEGFGCPGASVGLLLDGQTRVVSAGIADLATGSPVTAATAFQIGSNTKLLTATLVMQLVERGAVELDAPVTRYLPDFHLAVPGAAERITIRHLLTHTSGIDGDFEGVPGHGFSDSMVEEYVTAMSGVGLVHAPGAGFSYCNAGWVLLGRVVEVSHRLPFHEVLRTQLAIPLGMAHLGVAPDDIASWPLAHGTLPDPETGAPRPAPAYVTAPACAPAGSSPVATASDLLAFLEMHLNDGVSRDGSRILSPASVLAMQERQLDVPQLGMTQGWGLGWMVGHTQDGQRVLAHGGGTLGQLSHLQVLPDRRLALVVLTNGLGGGGLGLALIASIFERMAGAEIPPTPSSPTPTPVLELSNYVGRYERIGTLVEVTAIEGRLQAVVTQASPVPGMEVIPPMTVWLDPVDEQTFVVDGGGIIRFQGFEGDGRASYIFNSRRIPRTV